MFNNLLHLQPAGCLSHAVVELKDTSPINGEKLDGVGSDPAL